MILKEGSVIGEYRTLSFVSIETSTLCGIIILENVANLLKSSEKFYFIRRFRLIKSSERKYHILYKYSGCPEGGAKGPLAAPPNF